MKRIYAILFGALLAFTLCTQLACVDPVSGDRRQHPMAAAPPSV